MITYEEATRLSCIARCSRPDGYNGKRIETDIKLHGTQIIEVYPFGCIPCGAVPTAADAAEVNRLIDNHPNFKQYRRVT